MLKNIESNLRQIIFVIKTAACCGALLAAGFFFAAPASMQDGGGRAMSANNMNIVNAMSGNYRPTPEPPKVTIRGRVIYADTGGTVRRAGLMLMPTGGANRSGRENTGLTNERGEFEIKNVAAGRYFVSVNVPGVVTPFSSLSNLGRMDSLLNNSEMANILKDFQEIVVSGANDVDVTIAARRGAAISGRIIYADGEAAVGVRVEILRKKNGEYSALIPNIGDIFGAIFGGAGGMKTDDRGVFRLAGLPAGEYFVRVLENVSHSDASGNRGDEMIAMGFNPNSMVATYYPNTDDVKKAETIKLELGQEFPEINLTIPVRTLQTANGIVVNKATKQPIKGARVSIKNKNAVKSLFGDRGGMSADNRTDAQGRWNYKNLPTGEYVITVEPPYDYDSSDEAKAARAKQPKFADAQKEIRVEGKDLTDLVIELGYGATVSGTISYENQEPLPSAVSIMLIEENGKFVESTGVYAERGNDGKSAPAKVREFKVEGIPNGKTFLKVTSNFYGEDEKQDFYVKSVLYNGKEISHSTLEIKEGDELKGLQIILSKDAGKLKGKVIRTDKSTVGGARLSLIPTDKQKWNNANAVLYAATNGDGEFEVSGAPGEYFVVFDKDSDAPNAPDETGRTPAEKRREFYEKQISGALKAMLKAKETESLTLTLPD